jgi:hypothetical protein
MRPKKTSTFSVAGWLFADLFLGLMILFLIADIGDAGGVFAVAEEAGLTAPPTLTPTSTVQPTYTPYPTYTPFPTPSPVPTVSPMATALPTAVIGLDQDPIVVKVDPGQDVVAAVRAAHDRNPSSRVGLMITFGYARSVAEGVTAARAANTELKTAFPDWIPEHAPTKELSWVPDASGSEGTIRLELYVLREITEDADSSGSP